MIAERPPMPKKAVKAKKLGKTKLVKAKPMKAKPLTPDRRGG
jgi:hypothetical protein